MTDDIELVRDYAARQSDGAFETLVSRHINLVYSVALRQPRDAQLAEEIKQKEIISDDEVHLHIHAAPSAEALHSGKVIIVMKKLGSEWKQAGDL